MANQLGSNPQTTPVSAKDAVLKPSAPIVHGTRQVHGVEFNEFRERDITVKELIANMSSMGFQASAVAEAARIINDMVSYPYPSVEAMD